MRATAAWFQEERDVARPSDQLRISEWAEKYLLLPPDSQIKGTWSAEMTPFFVPIMNACLDPYLYSISICASSQIGKTMCVFGIIGYFVHQFGTWCMIVLADQDTSEDMSRDRLKWMFENSESLSPLIDFDRWTKDTLGFKNFAKILMAWASSVAKVASKSVGLVYADEIDKPGYSLTTKEAPPLSLMEERLNTYSGAKFLKSSTPTDEQGNVTKELERADAVFDWHVPCPACGQFQPLRWTSRHAWGFQEGKFRAEEGTLHDLGEVVWEGGSGASNELILKTARYKCGECGGLWTTIEKNEAVRAGKYVPRKEESGFERSIAFHISRLYSLFPGGSLEKMVLGWVNIHRIDNIEERNKATQGFVNSSLAEPWAQRITVTSETAILDARCDLAPQTVPQEAIALTCFIDVQKYSFWFAVRAWARDYTSWLVHYGQLTGWEEVENLLFEAEYPVFESDSRMKIWRAAVDTGGGEREYGPSMTEETYLWLRKIRHGTGRGCRVWATKGSSGPLAGKIHVGKPLDKTPSGHALPGGLQIVSLDTGKLKDAFHYRLQLAAEKQPMGAYLHCDTDHVYVSHILAEEKRRSQKGVEEWVKKGKRNDLLDCEVGNLALADPEWPGGGVNLLRGSTGKAIPPPGDEGQEAKQEKPVERRVNPYLGGRPNPFGRSWRR